MRIWNHSAKVAASLGPLGTLAPLYDRVDWPKGRSLRVLLLAGLVLFNALVLALTVTTLHSSRKHIELLGATQSQNIVNAIEQNVVFGAEKIDLALSTLADEVAAMDGARNTSRQGIQALLERCKNRLPEVDGIRLSDERGLVIAGTGVGSVNAPSIVDRDYFKNLRDLAGTDLQITKPVVGRIVKRPIVIFARRHGHADGSFAGVVFATVSIDHFFRMLSHYDLGPSGVVALRDAELGLIARVPTVAGQPSSQLGDRGVSREYRALFDTGIRTATFRTPSGSDGIARIATFRRLEKLPFVINAGVATQDILAPWWAEVYRTVTLAAGFLVMSVLSSTVVLRLLREAAKREDLLTRSGVWLNHAQQVARIGSFDWNVETKELRWSDEHFRLWGLRPQCEPPSPELLRRGVHPQDWPRAQCMLCMQAPTSGHLDCTVRTVWADSSEHHIRVLGQWVPGEPGRPGRVVGTAQEITQQVLIEAELTRHRHHLEAMVLERTAQLEIASAAAEAASRTKSAFLANMSHEIRTPLNAITGLAYMLTQEGLPPAQASKVYRIELAGRHLLEIIDSILDLSKIEAGKLVLCERDVNIAAIIANVLSMLSDRARAKGLDMQVENEAIPHCLLGDSTLLQQGLLNFAANAVKFTTSGSVTLRARVDRQTEADALIRFEVSDTGEGISAEAVSRLFLAFEQADNSVSRKHGGTGLGLAITKKLAQAMGGEAGVESQLGQGSTFWFTALLKKVSEAAPGPTTAASSQPAARALARSFGGRRILLVEDESTNREIAGYMLKAVGLVVEFAENGVEAVELSQAHTFDLILMDLQMAPMDGLEATRLIRTQGGAGRRIPIIAISANAFAEDRAECLNAGMDDFVSKPIAAEMLYSALLRWLRDSSDRIASADS